MAKYKALSRLYVNSRIIDEGALFDSEDPKGQRWELVEEKPKQQLKAKTKADSGERE